MGDYPKPEVENIRPKYYAQRCPVCNGFGTLKYGAKVCQACGGKGYVLVPTGLEGGENDLPETDQ